MSSETNVIDTTPNPAGVACALAGELAGVVAGADMVRPGDKSRGLAAEPQAASETIAMTAAAADSAWRAALAPRRRAEKQEWSGTVAGFTFTSAETANRVNRLPGTSPGCTRRPWRRRACPLALK
jgi:hypothetical protein